MATRTFVVKVSDGSPRVIVEDVRTRQRVATALGGLAEQIARWLEPEPSSPPADRTRAPEEHLGGEALREGS